MAKKHKQIDANKLIAWLDAEYDRIKAELDSQRDSRNHMFTDISQRICDAKIEQITEKLWCVSACKIKAMELSKY